MPKTNIFTSLPTDILLLIFEYEGHGKEHFKKVLQQFSAALKSRIMYNCVYSCINREDSELDSFINNKFYAMLALPMYKFILQFGTYTNRCKCERPCCYQFHYDYTNSKYNCYCHAKISRGISHSFPFGSRQRINIKTNDNGLCVKITQGWR